MLGIVLVLLLRGAMADTCYEYVEVSTWSPFGGSAAEVTTVVDFFTTNSDGSTTPIHGMTELSSGVGSDGALCGLKGKFDDGSDTAWGVDGSCEDSDWITQDGLRNVHFTGVEAAVDFTKM